MPTVCTCPVNSRSDGAGVGLRVGAGVGIAVVGGKVVGDGLVGEAEVGAGEGLVVTGDVVGMNVSSCSVGLPARRHTRGVARGGGGGTLIGSELAIAIAMAPKFRFESYGWLNLVIQGVRPCHRSGYYAGSGPGDGEVGPWGRGGGAVHVTLHDNELTPWWRAHGLASTSGCRLELAWSALGWDAGLARWWMAPRWSVRLWMAGVS